MVGTSSTYSFTIVDGNIGDGGAANVDGQGYVTMMADSCEYVMVTKMARDG
jgi:hypothetical protein